MSHTLCPVYKQANPDAFCLGGVDHELEEKIRRRDEREEAAELRRQKEKDRVANEQAANANAGVVSDEEDDDGANIPLSHSILCNQSRVDKLVCSINEL